MTDKQTVLAYMEAHLKPSRMAHTLAVAETAVLLAKAHGCDEDKAELAALMHDAAKYMSEEQALAICRKADIDVDEWTRKIPQILHAPAGAALAKCDFEVTDEDILNALLFHTTARAGMSLLEMIIYLADMIEPTRKPFDGLEEIRQIAFVDLEEALLKALDSSLRYVMAKKEMIHPLTVLARNALLEQRKHS